MNPRAHSPRHAFALVDAALNAASTVSRIDRKTLLVDCRYHHVSRARQAAYLVAYENGVSYLRIGKRMSRNHSTVSYGVRVARREEAACPNFAAMVGAIRGLCA